MKQRFFIWGLAMATLGVVNTALAERVECKSQEYQYNHCRVDTQGGVRLVEQTSNSSCREGESWGYDRNGIWVDKGCAGVFDTRANSNAGGSHGGGGSGTLICESQNYEYNHCRAATDSRVTLVRQLSNSECREGQSWGVDNRGIWVDRGCSAEFRLGDRGASSFTSPTEFLQQNRERVRQQR